MWIVYILKCSDKTYYVGYTSNFGDRIARHERGEVYYTSVRLPVQLVHQSVFFDKYKALEFEKCLKSGSGRTFSKKHLL
jgi:putative endonuclease